jgi:hypothetical protein
VREIEVDGHGRASGAVYVDRTGRTRRQRARVVILAANGIGTARLLLLSKSGRFPDGLANSSDLVGRRLMFHPYSAVLGEFEENLHSWRGPYGQIIESYQFYETDKHRGFVRGAKWGVLPNGGPLGVSSIAGAKVFEADTLEASWGEALHRNVERRLGRCLVVSVIGEDLPHASNRVVLDDTLVDSDGIPAPRILYRVDENSRRLLRFHETKAVEFLQAAGASTTSIVHQMRLVHARHRRHGRRSRAVGGRWLGARPRRAEPLHRRRQRVHHFGRRQSHRLDHVVVAADGAPHRRRAAQPGGSLRWPDWASVPSRRNCAHFAAIADVLVPAYRHLPSASAVGIERELLDRVLAVRPDLVEAFVRGIESTLGSSPRQAAETLFHYDPVAFDAVATAASGGYYLDPGVRALLGYPGQENIPNDAPRATPDYVTDGTLRRVFDRGPIYVPTPGVAALSDPHPPSTDR